MRRIKMNIENHQENEQLNSMSTAGFGLIRASIGLTAVTLAICGFAYSSVAAGLGQVIFPHQANGSLIVQNGEVIGSSLVAQPFIQAKYFQPRPSASNYDPMAMAGGNLARTNPALHEMMDERLNKIVAQERVEKSQIPSDLVTASGSGIDPEISLQAALIQVNRIAAARGMSVQDVETLVLERSIRPSFGILGQTRVNVLEINIALDQAEKAI
jgi:potassium-transporting ATPase KdpC subunit